MTTRILFQGRWVRGWPCEMASRRQSSRSATSLCLKTRMLPPELRAPTTSDEWFVSSEMIRSPLLISAGSVVELVAKPMPVTIAAGLPT